MFLSPFAGYTLSALFSDRLHRLVGRRGIAFISPSCKLIAYIVISVHPPYPAVVVILALAGIGNGLLDAAWNAWIGTMDHPNQILGLLHGCYGLGATISPLVGTSMVTKAHLNWWEFYYIMAGLVTAEIVVGTTAFWAETGVKYRDTNRADGEEKGMTGQALRNKVTWICSAFFLAYVGTEGMLSLQLPDELPCKSLHPYSLTWRLGRHLHDPRSTRSTLPLRYDSHRILARYHIRPSGSRFHHA